MPVQTMDQRLDGRLVDVANVRRCLSRFTASDNSRLADKSEGVDHNFTLHRLNGINDDGNGSRIQRFERLEIGVVSVGNV